MVSQFQTATVAAEPKPQSGEQLEKLADEQFAHHRCECLDNYRDAIFAMGKSGANPGAVLRVTEKLHEALIFGQIRTSGISVSVIDSRASNLQELTKALSLLEKTAGCSDECFIGNHLKSWIVIVNASGALPTDIKSTAVKQGLLKVLTPTSGIDSERISQLIKDVHSSKKPIDTKLFYSQLQDLPTGVMSNSKDETDCLSSTFPGFRAQPEADRAVNLIRSKIESSSASDEVKLYNFSGWADKCIDTGHFLAARIFIDGGLIRVKDKSDERSKTFLYKLLQQQARVDVELADYARAEKDIQAFEATARPSNKEGKAELLDARGWRGRMLLIRGDFEKAQDLLEQLGRDWRHEQLETFIQSHYREHILDLARSYFAQKKFDDCANCLRAYLGNLGYGPSYPQHQFASSLLALVYQRTGHAGLAQTMIEETMDDSREPQISSCNIDAAYTAATIGDYFRDSGNPIRAERYYEGARDILRQLNLKEIPLARQLKID